MALNHQLLSQPSGELRVTSLIQYCQNAEFATSAHTLRPFKIVQCMKLGLKFLMLKTLPLEYRWVQTSPLWTQLSLPSKMSLHSHLGEPLCGDHPWSPFSIQRLILSPVLHLLSHLLALHSPVSGHNVSFLKSLETPLPVFRRNLKILH